MRVLSNVPVYRAGCVGFTSIEETDGVLEVRFIPFKLVEKLKYSPPENFWKRLYKDSYVQRYNRDDSGYEKTADMYRNEEEFPLENLTREGLVYIAGLLKKKAA